MILIAYRPNGLIDGQQFFPMQDRIFLTGNLEEESSTMDANIGSSYTLLIGVKGITSTTCCALLDRGELTGIISYRTVHET